MKSKKSSDSKLKFFQRPLFGVVYWKRIRVSDGLSKKSETFKNAKRSAAKHSEPELPAFIFTESRPEWVLLYDLARKGQITPKIMRYMRRADLSYLAGHTFPHPGLTQPKNQKDSSQPYVWFYDESEKKWDQATKLQGNAARAKAEIDRRNFIWSSFLIVLGAVAGGFLGSGIVG